MNRICIALLLGLLPLQASAACFTVFDKQHRIIYRDTVPPIDLTGPVSEALNAKFPGGHLVISSENLNCIPVVPGSPVDTRGAAAAAAPAAATPIQKQ